MAHWFEDLTKTLADEKIDRRTAIRRVTGTVAGVAFASALPRLAEAKTNKRCPFCMPTCNNTCDPYQCVDQNNPNCNCLTELGGKPVCVCNAFCSQLQTCSSSMKCPKSYACIVSTGCNCSTSQGVCFVRCRGKNKNCKFPDGHGLTATGRVV